MCLYISGISCASPCCKLTDSHNNNRVARVTIKWWLTLTLMARRQASCNKTTRTTAKSSSKPLVRRHSKRLQRQQRDLPTLLQDLSCVQSDQVSGEEDASSILTQSGSDISLQDVSRDCSSKVSTRYNVCLPGSKEQLLNDIPNTRN